jgi:hypothetical protein
MKIKHIYTTDEIEDPKIPLIQRDYYNERARITREKLEDKLFIQALLDALTEKNTFKTE